MSDNVTYEEYVAQIKEKSGYLLDASEALPDTLNEVSTRDIQFLGYLIDMAVAHVESLCTDPSGLSLARANQITDSN